MPKSISAAVGRGAASFNPTDVLTVQYLLNCVPSGSGGPQPELVLDGICGPKTTGAIERFQNWQLGFADGRVDPGGKTIRALQQFDPAPNQPLGGLGHSKGGFGKASGKGFGKGGGVIPGGSKTTPSGPAPWHGKTPGGKHGGQAPIGKAGSGGGFPPDPWGKSSGKSGPGSKSGQDPWSKTGGKMGSGGKFG